MVEKERTRNFSWFLDKEEENIVFVRFVFAPDGKGLEEFSVSYCNIVEGCFYEIVRYDCSGREAVHIHQFYRKPVAKRVLGKEKSFGTMAEFTALIEKNWREYLQGYKEKRQTKGFI